MKPTKTFFAISTFASALAVWLYLVTQVNANVGNLKLMVLLVSSFIVWFGCLVAFVLFQARVRQGNREIIFAHIAPSVRQGAIVAITVALIFVLKALDVVTPWEIILVVVGAVLFEVALERQSKRGS